MKTKLFLLILTLSLLVLFLRFWINSPRHGFILPPIYKLDTSTKSLAFTFDDGPNPEVTPQLLEVLKKYQVKATFFVNGNKLKQYPEIASQIVAEGHVLGNHSFYHDAMVFKSYEFIEQDLLQTDSLIYQAGQSKVELYRPPYGKSFINLPRVLRDHHRKMINWSIAPATQYDIPFNKEGIVNQVLEKLAPGGIILLHDGMDQVTGLGLSLAVEAIVKEAKSKGYDFVLVNTQK